MVITKRGFTIVELMIAVLVTSIVVIAAYALLNGTTSNFDNEDEQNMLRSNLRNAELLVQRDIGRAAFRSGYQAWTDDTKNPTDVAYQAIRHARTKSNNKYFSQLTVIGDITDFGYFYIDRASNKTVSFNNTALTGLQNNDCLLKVANNDGSVKTLTCPIGYCQNCQSGTEEAGAGLARFNEAFVQAFQTAGAVRFTSTSTNKSSVRELTSANISTNELTLARSLNLPTDQGFAAFCTGDKITPITAITYTVMPSGTENVLVRCTIPINIPSNGIVNAKSCAIVLRNVDYFDVFPLKSGQSLSTQLSTTQVKSRIDEAFTNSTSGKLDWQSTSIPVKDIAGITFRLGIHNSTPAKNPQYDPTVAAQKQEHDNMYIPAFYVDSNNKVYNRSHIQSSASIYTQPNSEDWSIHSGNIATLDQTALTISL